MSKLINATYQILSLLTFLLAIHESDTNTLKAIFYIITALYYRYCGVQVENASDDVTLSAINGGEKNE